MESSGSSFIPQRPTRGKVAAKSFRKIYVLSYVSYLVFFTTMLAVGGVFVYQLMLKSELDGLKEQLVSQKNLFSQTDLDRVRNLDYRIDAASQLVSNHASLLTVFRALDNTIADPIQLLNFSYDRKENHNSPRVTLAAMASEFDEVIFQEQILASNPMTRGFKVANVNLSTVPVDQERLELGVRQVVNINLTAELSVPDINFTGFTAVSSALPSAPVTTSESIMDEFEDTDAAAGESTQTTQSADEAQITNDSDSGQF